MIVRINLHPDRKAKSKSGPFKTVGVILGIVILVEIIACISTYNKINSSVKQLVAQERREAQERDEIKARLADVDKIKKQIEELRNREMTFAKLAALRTGPQYILNELARLLSNPRDVVARRAAQEAEWSLTWDPENIILTKFSDIGNSEIEIFGTARTNDDIGEFWKRLKSSPLMRNVRLGEVKDGHESTLKITTQSFSFTIEVNFNYQTQDGLALIDLLTNESAEEAPSGGSENEG